MYILINAVLSNVWLCLWLRIINLFHAIELKVAFVFSDAEFKNTGLERSEGLAKDLEWFKEQGHAIPEPSSPGINYAQYVEELSEKDPPAFLCHFYNTYFAHSAGGRMIGKKVSRISILLILYYQISLLHTDVTMT